MKTIIIISALLLVAACATKEPEVLWVKEGTTEEVFNFHEGDILLYTDEDENPKGDLIEASYYLQEEQIIVDYVFFNDSVSELNVIDDPNLVRYVLGIYDRF